MPRVVCSLLIIGSLGLMLGGAPASAQLSSLPPGDSLQTPLDVPYLPQSELLCGGAALAMVERYWGSHGVYAEDFAHLVQRVKGGISTTDLVNAAKTRGWDAAGFDGTIDLVQRLLHRRIPVIALIEVAPRRYHYVVLLQWSEGRVIYHDPARAPSREISEDHFLKEWRGGEQWAMAVQPGAPTLPPTVTAPSAVTTDSMPCRPYVDQALDAVDIDSLQRAATLLTEAQRACPAEPVVQREMAGVRFKQRRYDQATLLAEAYLARVPSDTLGWRLLAASRYLDRYPDAALAAWNKLGEPVVDLVRIDGIRRVRFQVYADAIDIPHGEVLTLRRQALARRRLAEVPAIRRSAVGYQALADGGAEVRAGVAERPVLDPWPAVLVSNGVTAIARHRVELTVATPTGAGELWTAGLRWDRAHPQVGLRLDVPFRLGVPGIVTVDGGWERFRFDAGPAPDLELVESRRYGGLMFGSWLTPALRPQVGVRYDRWSGDRRYVAVSGGVEYRALRDRVTVTSAFEHGGNVASTPSYDRGNLRALWASSPGLLRAGWSARIGGDLVSRTTPTGLWPVASGELPWAIPLRAHSWVRDGRLPGSTIGRLILHSGLSADLPFHRTGPITFAFGVFVDGAQVADPIRSSSGAQFYVDAGGGLRVGILDGELGVLRIDLATGLNDRTTAVTVGLHRRWPVVW